MVKVTRRGYTELVEKFQETGDNKFVGEMVEYLEVSLKQHTYKQLRRVTNYGYSFDDVYSLVLHTLWDSMKRFDGSKGSDFLAYLSQRIHWAVNDQLIEKKGSLADKRYATSISLSALQDEDDEYMTSDMIQYMNTDNLDLSYNDNSMLMVDYVLTYRRLLDMYVAQADYVGKQIREGIKNDEIVLNVIFEAVEDNKVSAREINERLYKAFPDVSKATVRRRKKMATDRFGKFIKENI